MGPKFLDGPADLIVEIVSEDDPARDREVKFFEYEAAGVTEYWVIDSREGHERADFYVLAADPAGSAREVYVARSIEDGIYRSTVLPELWVRLRWLWDEEAQPLRCAVEVLGRERVTALLDE
jgi:Uma2 family endonuclease